MNRASHKRRMAVVQSESADLAIFNLPCTQSENQACQTIFIARTWWLMLVIPFFCRKWEHYRNHPSKEGRLASPDTIIDAMLQIEPLWRRLVRGTQRIFKAKKRQIDKRDTRIAEAARIHKVLLLFWIGLA